MRANDFISITATLKMQIFRLKMFCLHIWWMQTVSANTNTADPVALASVYLQEHLSVDIVFQ